MLSYVLALRFSQTFEACNVPIQDIETVGDFIGPEIEVCDMARELVRIQCHETRELRRQLLGNGNCVSREGWTPACSYG